MAAGLKASPPLVSKLEASQVSLSKTLTASASYIQLKLHSCKLRLFPPHSANSYGQLTYGSSFRKLANLPVPSTLATLAPTGPTTTARYRAWRQSEATHPTCSRQLAPRLSQPWRHLPGRHLRSTSESGRALAPTNPPPTCPHPGYKGATQPIRLGFYLHRAQDDNGPKPTWQWAMPGTTAHDVLRAEQSLLGRTQIVTSLLDDHFVPLPLDALLEPSQTYTISSQPDEAITPTEPFVVFVTWLQEQITYKAQPGMRLFQLAAALDLTQDQQWTDEEGIQLPLDVLLQPNALYAYHERPDPSPAIAPNATPTIEEPPVPTLYYGGMHTPAATSLAETPNDDSSVSHDSSVISTLETLRSATRGQRERGHENYATEYLNSAGPFHLWRVQQLASHAPWLAHDEMAYHLTLLHRLAWPQSRGHAPDLLQRRPVEHPASPSVAQNPVHHPYRYSLDRPRSCRL